LVGGAAGEAGGVGGEVEARDVVLYLVGVDDLAGLEANEVAEFVVAVD